MNDGKAHNLRDIFQQRLFKNPVLNVIHEISQTLTKFTQNALIRAFVVVISVIVDHVSNPSGTLFDRVFNLWL